MHNHTHHTCNCHGQNDSNCGCGHSHHHSHSGLRKFIPEILTGILLISALAIRWESHIWELIAYLAAVVPVGFPILKSTIKEWLDGDFFNEFTLMVLACAGAFLIKEYPEGVAILLFYSFGEKLEDIVSGDVKDQIKKLMGKMPRNALLLKDGKRIVVTPEDVNIGDIIVVKPGEAVPLDGNLISEEGADFNTAAITGESFPKFIAHGEEINSGIIPIDKEILLKVSHKFKDSSMNRIMKMIEDASSNRAPSETVLRKITRWYTPIVFVAAVLLFVIPWIVGLCNSSYMFEWNVWLRRSLVFLVCSCPCALIVSIPLTYFTSIGIASRKGILFKGHDSLDMMRKVDVFMFDKTGTVTTGNFHIEKIKCYGDWDETSMLGIVSAIEKSSSHPLAKAIVSEAVNRGLSMPVVENIFTVNHGMKGELDGRKILVGSKKILTDNGVLVPRDLSEDGTTVYIAEDGIFIGFISLSDTLKEGVGDVIDKLHEKGIKQLGILSGDAESAVSKVKIALNVDFAQSGLMPADKKEIIDNKKRDGMIAAFAGDGINDAPALAAADLGIAMGTVGTDMAIESAGVVIAGDELSKIIDGIDISRKVKNVIWENVTFAFGVKLIIMILGAFGIASLWAAVFADTGVTVITIFWTLLRLRIWELRKKEMR